METVFYVAVNDARIAGPFRFMTSAILWAIENCDDTQWTVEPVASPEPTEATADTIPAGKP